MISPTIAKRACRWLALLLALMLATPAAAHPAPFSYLDIHLRDGAIDGTLVVHIFDLGHDLGVSPPERLLDTGQLGARRQDAYRLLAPRMALRTDHRLTPAWTGAVPVPEHNTVKVSFRIPREQAAALTMAADMFPYDKFHQTFVNVYEGDRLRQQWIFSKGSAERTYYRGGAWGVLEVIKTFVPAGIHHILIGPDHLLFLVGLLLLGGSWRTLVRIVTAFTLGHSITLSLAALDIVTPPPAIIEPAIALSIVVVGTDNLLRGGGRDLRAWAALGFGLIHGFGFANVLREFGLPREALGWSLFSFNIGVELGQLAVVIVVASLLEAIRRVSPATGRRVAVAGSVVVIAAGTYWFLQRIISPGGA